MARKRQRSTVPDVPAAPLAVTRVKRILAIRESDAANRLLFMEMIVKTVRAFAAQLPAVERLLTIGLDPFDHPELYQAQIIGNAKARTALFMLDDETLVMYHMGSAALEDDDTQPGPIGTPPSGTSDRLGVQKNFFTGRLISLLYRHEPDEVWVYALNRLVRDFENASRLQIALKDLGVVVRDGGRTYDLNDHVGMLNWSVLANFAAADRNGIVDRNLLGKIAQSRRNEWPFGKQHIPFGYMLDGRTIKPDPDKVEAVRAVLELLADANLTAAEFVEQAAKVGMSRPRMRQLHGDEAAMVDVAVHPKDVRASMVNWIELYETGVYRITMPCPTASAETYGGLPVWADPDNGDRQTVTLAYTFGVPNSGWAPPSLFELIRARNRADNVFTTVVTKGRRRPFGARPPYQTDDGSLLVLDTGTSSGYRLRTVVIKQASSGQESPAQTRPIARNTMRTAETVATFKIRDLHRTVADGIADALSSVFGIDGQFIATDYLPVLTEHDEQRALLEARLTRLRGDARRAAENAARLEQSESRQVFFDFADECQQQITLAEAELRELDTRATDDRTPRSLISHSAAARLLAQLANTDGACDGAFVDALNVVLPRIEIHPTGRSYEFEWRAVLRLPLDDGRTLELGPITGNLRATTRRQRHGMSASGSVTNSVLHHWTNGASIADMSASRGRTTHQTLQVIYYSLIRGGYNHGVAMILRRAEPVHLRRLLVAACDARVPAWIDEQQPDIATIARRLTDEGLVPDGCDPMWAANALYRYQRLSPPPGHYLWDKSSPLVRAVIDTVLAGQDTIADIDAAMHATDRRRRRILELLHVLESANAPLVRIEPWITHERGAIDPSNRVALANCHRCDHAMTVYLNIAEIDGTALCPVCRTSNAPDSPVYPESYVCPNTPMPVPDDIPTRRRGIPPDVAQQAAALYQQGVPTLDIRDLLNISNSQLYRALEAHDVEPRRPYRQRQTKKP